MQLLNKLAVFSFIAAPGGDVLRDDNGTERLYVLRYFRCRRPRDNSNDSRLSARTSKTDYDSMLDTPYYNRDFEEEDYNEIMEEEEAEEEEDMDDIDRQLREIEEEKQFARRLDRMVKRSAAMELPKTKVETQRMFPPGKPNDEAANAEPKDIPISKILSMSQHEGIPDGEVTHVSADRVVNGHTSVLDHDSLEGDNSKVDLPPLKGQYDDYDPVKLPGFANTTSELITGIIQMPKVKGIKSLQVPFKIKDYTENDDDRIPEDNIWLEAINEERRKSGKPEIKPEEGKDLRDNPEFVKEQREVQLKHTKDIRKMWQEHREKREALKHTFYRKLPRNERGYAVLQKEDLDKLSFEEVKEELRTRGYRTAGGEKLARRRLSEGLEENSEWRYQKIVAQPLDEKNENLPTHSREKIIELKVKMKFLKEAGFKGDLMTAIERLKARQEVIQFHDDPVGYLELDRDDPSMNASPEEMEEMRNAPVVHDTQFIEALQSPINRLPDIIPRTFNLQPDVERPYPEYHAMHKQELEDLKREYLSFEGGIHEMTLPEISRRFEISLDFLGDACCRLGARAPVLLDMPLRGIISYSAMWDLIEFLNIADTLEVETFYTFLDIEDLAKELGKTVEEIVSACNKLGIKLPFENKTKLNLHCLTIVEKLLKDPDLDIDLLSRDRAYRDPFEDTTDKRPVFPNSMTEINYDRYMNSENI